MPSVVACRVASLVLHSRLHCRHLASTAAAWPPLLKHLPRTCATAAFGQGRQLRVPSTLTSAAASADVHPAASACACAWRCARAPPRRPVPSACELCRAHSGRLGDVVPSRGAFAHTRPALACRACASAQCHRAPGTSSMGAHPRRHCHLVSVSRSAKAYPSPFQYRGASLITHWSCWNFETRSSSSPPATPVAPPQSTGECRPSLPPPSPDGSWSSKACPACAP
jgi:hypothetical protein